MVEVTYFGQTGAGRDPRFARCIEACTVHDTRCMKVSHLAGLHYCSRCPGPADRRMVRRGSR